MMMIIILISKTCDEDGDGGISTHRERIEEQWVGGLLMMM